MRLARTGDPGSPSGDRATSAATSAVDVANLCNLLNPSRVVLGGDLAEAGELVLGADKGVRRRGTPSPARPADSRWSPGHSGRRAEVLGALALALSEMGDSTLLDGNPR